MCPTCDIFLKALLPFKGNRMVMSRIVFFVKENKNKKDIIARIQGYHMVLGISKHPLTFKHLLNPTNDAHLLSVLANMQS